MPFLILDANIISRIRRVDHDCSLLNFFSVAYGLDCAYHRQQYLETPCSMVLQKPDCKDLRKRQHGEHVIDFANKYKKEISKITRDLADVEILCFAHDNEGSIILTCDSNLLKVYCMRSTWNRTYLFQSCFETIDDDLDGGLFSDSSMNTDWMQNDPDPFCNYSISSKCFLCDPDKKCQFHN
uniref:PIN domain-containing protein n=1 Tax=Candidatus Kentrum sp. MB TaxID=2138164 RepID=A0A450XJM1_9GAMM|nr:MAG: hypothetical protein BECKMB1821I_GA0114274_101039 [Candidatus Kentron sp. MB]VFK74812.1 MAG: hypothetical protein BECKMB1821H_GA0114242_101039 [Candidatus Kentron sp. MB]